jgi:hypothetical protein
LNLARLFEGREATIIDIDEPEQYRKRGTVWKVNGQRALPENGALPAHAGKLAGGLSLGLENLYGGFSEINPEQLIMTYLDNVNSMIQDQRDILFSYFEQAEAIPRSMLASWQSTADSTDVALRIATPIETAGQGTGRVGGATGAAETGEPGDALPDILQISVEEVMTLILTVVSDKTGYPVDMLDFDADLEADLSIDSIKKMEILGGLRERATFPEDDDREDSFEKLISIKTLKGMLDWIQSLETGESARFADERELKDFVAIGQTNEQ